MATSSRKPRPGLTLTAFLVVVGLMYTLMAVTSTWTPKLGLDLRTAASALKETERALAAAEDEWLDLMLLSEELET